MESKQGSTKRIKTDFLSLFLSWLRGVGGKLSRMVRRLLYPNRGRRAQMVAHTPDLKLSPLAGIETIRQKESLTVGSLIAKVEWQVPKQISTQTSAVQTPEMTSMRKGIPGFGESESLTVGNLQVSGQLTTPRPITEEIPETDPKVKIASIKAAYPAGRIHPLVGTENISHRRSLTVGNLLGTVRWQIPDRSARTSEIEDEINWD